jgi:hypothetical protein
MYVICKMHIAHIHITDNVMYISFNILHRTFVI